MKGILNRFKVLWEKLRLSGKNLDGRFLTLFVLTNDASKPRQFKVPLRHFRFAGIAGFACVFVLSLMMIDYVRLKWDEFDLWRLKRENTAQRMELQGFAARIKDIEAQLAKLSLLDRKIREVARMALPKSFKPEQVMGLGGDSSDDGKSFTTPGAKVDELVNEMRSDISKVELMAKKQEESFSELQEHLMKQASILASTPSIWPARGWITSSYGTRVSPFTGDNQRHTGIDIANSVGTPVFAAADGIVIEAGMDQGLGRMIVVSHGYGMKTTYGHLSSMNVKAGQKVKRGARIGSIGNSGRSTGPHLHYEVSLNGIAVNPAKYIQN